MTLITLNDLFFSGQLKKPVLRHVDKQHEHNDMKKTIFIACCFSLFASLTTAQQLSIGVRGGYTRSDVHTSTPDGLGVEVDPNASFKPINGWHGGVDVHMMLGSRLGLQASLLYAKKGFVSKLYWPTGPADAYWNLHYLNLPVLLDYRVFKGLCVQGGAELGRLLSTRVKSGSENFEREGLYKEFDFGLVAGLEYRFNNGLFVNTRQIFGLYTILETEISSIEGQNTGTAKSRNNSTQLSVGYRHTFGE